MKKSLITSGSDVVVQDVQQSEMHTSTVNISVTLHQFWWKLNCH